MILTNYLFYDTQSNFILVFYCVLPYIPYIGYTFENITTKFKDVTYSTNKIIYTHREPY